MVSDRSPLNLPWLHQLCKRILSGYMICVSRPRLRQGAFLRRIQSAGGQARAACRPVRHEVLYRESIPGRLFGETRKDEKMTPVAADFTDDDIRGPGAYFGSLSGPPAPAEADPDPALTKAAAALVKDRHCAQCHPAVCRSGRNSAIGWAASGNDRKSVARLSARRAPRGAAASSCRRSPIRWMRTTSNRSRISCRARARHETVTVRPTPRVEPRAR
jgi:hypothetical protein